MSGIVRIPGHIYNGIPRFAQTQSVKGKQGKGLFMVQDNTKSYAAAIRRSDEAAARDTAAAPEAEPAAAANNTRIT